MIEGESLSMKYTMQSTPLNKRQNLTELRVICATAGDRVKLALQPHSLSQISQNQAQKVKIPNIEVQKHRS
jgi:DNA helicase TIP49 (TBP-interacting protein)